LSESRRLKTYILVSAKLCHSHFRYKGFGLAPVGSRNLEPRPSLDHTVGLPRVRFTSRLIRWTSHNEVWSGAKDLKLMDAFSESPYTGNRVEIMRSDVLFYRCILHALEHKQLSKTKSLVYRRCARTHYYEI